MVGKAKGQSVQMSCSFSVVIAFSRGFIVVLRGYHFLAWLSLSLRGYRFVAWHIYRGNIAVLRGYRFLA